MPDPVADCKSLDTLDATEGGSSHAHSPQSAETKGRLLKFKQTMTVAVAQIFQERAISRINLPPKLPLEVGVKCSGGKIVVR